MDASQDNRAWELPANPPWIEVLLSKMESYTGIRPQRLNQVKELPPEHVPAVLDLLLTEVEVSNRDRWDRVALYRTAAGLPANLHPFFDQFLQHWRRE